MKCVLIFLSLVALSYSVPLTFGDGKQVTVDEDGTITILGENGKKIVLSKVIGHPGPKDIEIIVGGPNGPIKRIHLDDEYTKTVSLMDMGEPYYYDSIYSEDREKRSSLKDTTKSSKSSKDSKNTKEKSQADLLSEIFTEYQGVVDAKSYNDLLTKIDSYVKSGELNQAVYDVLHSFEQYQLAQKYGYQPAMDRFVKNQYPSNYYPASPYYNPFFGSRVFSPYFANRFSFGYPYRTYGDAAEFQKEREFFAQPRTTYGQFFPQYKQEQFGFEQPKGFFGQSGEQTYVQPREQEIEQFGQSYEQPKSSFYGQYEYPTGVFGQNKYTPFEQDFYNRQYQQPSTYKPFSFFHTL